MWKFTSPRIQVSCLWGTCFSIPWDCQRTLRNTDIMALKVRLWNPWSRKRKRVKKRTLSPINTQWFTSYFTSVSNLLSEESNWGKEWKLNLFSSSFYMWLHQARKTHLSISQTQKNPRHQQALFAISLLILHQDLQYWNPATKQTKG